MGKLTRINRFGFQGISFKTDMQIKYILSESVKDDIFNSNHGKTFLSSVENQTITYWKLKKAF